MERSYRNTAGRLLALGLGLGLGLGLAAGNAAAQAYPNKPIRAVVAFAPGGIADSIGRLIGQKLTERMGQSVVIENRDGAAGMLAAKAVAAASPDGYTLLVHTAAVAISASTSKDGAETVSELVPVALVASTPTIFAVSASVPANTLAEFIKYKGGKFSYSTAGVGTPPHLTAEFLFKTMKGVDAVHVPFRGGAPSITAVVAGQVDMVSTSMPPAVPLIKAGKMKALLATSPKRPPALPDVPTAAEAGFPDFEDVSWVAFFAPAKTPAAVVQKLNAEINEALKLPDVRERLTAIGFEPNMSSAPEFNAYMKKEVAKWAKIIKTIGFVPN
jgi:tripartite-type tricarboxylate transporter receptor subunit TctC